MKGEACWWQKAQLSWKVFFSSASPPKRSCDSQTLEGKLRDVLFPGHGLEDHLDGLLRDTSDLQGPVDETLGAHADTVTLQALLETDPASAIGEAGQRHGSAIGDAVVDNPCHRVRVPVPSGGGR
ncbi:MAG: hypothetical protein U5K56_07310 [Halioglobus sp.]|nr:hypothetical protein [Halioglobus sp.]